MKVKGGFPYMNRNININMPRSCHKSSKIQTEHGKGERGRNGSRGGDVL